MGPQIGSRWPQGAPKTVLKSVFSLLKIDFDFESFRDRFWLHFGSPNASLWAPFWRSKSIKKSIRNRTALKIAPRSLQERPRPSQDARRTLPDSPRTSQDTSQMPPRTPPDDPKCFSEASDPITFFGNIERFEIVERCRKLSRQCSSTMVTPHRPSQKSKVLSQWSEPQRVAAVVARSALQ